MLLNVSQGFCAFGQLSHDFKKGAHFLHYLLSNAHIRTPHLWARQDRLAWKMAQADLAECFGAPFRCQFGNCKRSW